MNNNLKIYNFVDYKKLKNNLKNKNFCLLQINNLRANESQNLYSTLRENNINIKKIKLNLIRNKLISKNLNKYLKSNTYILFFEDKLLFLLKFLKKNNNLLFPLNFFLAKKEINYYSLNTFIKNNNLLLFKEDSECKNNVIFFLVSKIKFLLINFIYYLKLKIFNNIMVYAHFKSTSKKM